MAEYMMMTAQAITTRKTTVDDVKKLSKCYCKILDEKSPGPNEIKYLNAVREAGEKVAERKLDVEEVKKVALAIDSRVVHAKGGKIFERGQGKFFTLVAFAIAMTGVAFGDKESHPLAAIIAFTSICTIAMCLGKLAQVINKARELAVTSIELNIKKIAGEKQ